MHATSTHERNGAWDDDFIQTNCNEKKLQASLISSLSCMVRDDGVAFKTAYHGFEYNNNIMYNTYNTLIDIQSGDLGQRNALILTNLMFFPHERA